jgi:heme-degrading monooxygenase HmoA
VALLQKPRIGQHVLTTLGFDISSWMSSLDARSNELGFSMPFIAKTPKPPYYAVIFTSINADVDHAEHTEMYHRMVELAATYDGFLGIEPARNTDGSGVAAIYWKDTDSIAAFSRDPEHLIAKKKGREIWYSHYMIRICKVERQYGRSD